MNNMGKAASHRRSAAGKKRKSSGNDEKETSPLQRAPRFQLVGKRVKINDIKTAREHVDVYGTPASRAKIVKGLTEDVRCEGLQRRIPVVEDEHGRLWAIAWVEWLEAARAAGVTQVWVDIVGRNLNRDERIVTMVRAHAGSPRTEWTLCLEGYHLFWAQKALTKQAQRDAGGDKVSAKAREARKEAVLPNSGKSGGSARDRAAALIGDGHTKFDMRLKLVKKAFEQSPKDPGASEIATFLNSEERPTVNAAYERFIEPRKKSAKKKVDDATEEPDRIANVDDEDDSDEEDDASSEVDEDEGAVERPEAAGKAPKMVARRATAPAVREPFGALLDALAALATARGQMKADPVTKDQDNLARAIVYTCVAYLRDMEGASGKGEQHVRVGKSVPATARDEALHGAIRNAAKDAKAKQALLNCVRDDDQKAVVKIVALKSAKVSSKGRRAILRVLARYV